MTVIRISDADDPRVGDYRGVSDPELVRARGLFIAEGRLVVQRLIDGGRATVRSLLLNDSAHRAIAPALAQLPFDTPVYVCDSSVLTTIAGFNIHRGCLALAERPHEMSLASVLANHRLVLVEGVANADNVGGIFRNAAAFGASVVLSPTCCDPLYRKAIRTSMGATLRVPFLRTDDWPGVLRDVRDGRFVIAALTPREPAQTLHEFATGRVFARIALLLGAEGAGLSAEAEAMADHRVRIPIHTGVDSLNVAVATGIALARLSEPLVL
jgi:tRNA G18 (ribose-2'-O)-methylase SpoU